MRRQLRIQGKKRREAARDRCKMSPSEVPDDFLFASKPTTLVEKNSSSFFESTKNDQNSINKHGSICSLYCRFQI